MTNEDFKKDLEDAIKPCIDNQPHILEKMLVYLKHRKECREKNTKPASGRHVTRTFKKAFPDEWTPGNTAVENWLIKMEREDDK